jgi:hypothetical protein
MIYNFMCVMTIWIIVLANVHFPSALVASAEAYLALLIDCID